MDRQTAREGLGVLMDLHRKDTCQCKVSHATGRKYFGFVACECGGLIVRRADKAAQAEREEQQRRDDFEFGRTIPNYWRPKCVVEEV